MTGKDNPPELSSTGKQWLYHREMYAKTGKEQHLRYMNAYVRHNPGLRVYDYPDEKPAQDKRGISVIAGNCAVPEVTAVVLTLIYIIFAVILILIALI